MQSIVACAGTNPGQVQLVAPRQLQLLIEAQEELPVPVNVIDLEAGK